MKAKKSKSTTTTNPTHHGTPVQPCPGRDCILHGVQHVHRADVPMGFELTDYANRYAVKEALVNGNHKSSNPSVPAKGTEQPARGVSLSENGTTVFSGNKVPKLGALVIELRASAVRSVRVMHEALTDVVVSKLAAVDPLRAERVLSLLGAVDDVLSEDHAEAGTRATGAKRGSESGGAGSFVLRRCSGCGDALEVENSSLCPACIVGSSTAADAPQDFDADDHNGRKAVA